MPELNLPTPGVTGGPGWASQLNEAIESVNSVADATAEVIETGRLSEAGLNATIDVVTAQKQLFPNRPPGAAFTYTEAPTMWESQLLVRTKAELLEHMGGKTSILTVVAVEVPQTAPNRLGNIYWYWSTDHDNSGGLGSSSGGIWMAHSDTMTGPWTFVAGAAGSGAVFVDTVEGDQTETPWVIVSGGVWYMYYQQRHAGRGAQTTMVATSSDGRSWTRQGPAMDWPSTYLPGDGHTGYAKVYKIGDLFVGFALCGGTEYGYKAVWYSRDGLRFTLDRRLGGYEIDVTGDNAKRLEGLYTLFEWRGEIWGETAITAPAAGGSTPATYQPVVGRMAQDLRGFYGGWFPTPHRHSTYLNVGGELWAVASGPSGVTIRKKGA